VLVQARPVLVQPRLLLTFAMQVTHT
jgi:hypothetical protein